MGLLVWEFGGNGEVGFSLSLRFIWSSPRWRWNDEDDYKSKELRM